MLGIYSGYSGIGIRVNRTSIPIYSKYFYSGIRSNERTLSGIEPNLSGHVMAALKRAGYSAVQLGIVWCNEVPQGALAYSRVLYRTIPSTVCREVHGRVYLVQFGTLGAITMRCKWVQ